MTRFLRHALPFVAAAVACTTPQGDRAQGNGACPVGETCSAATPNGLEFHGATAFRDLLDSGPLATAVGGTQAIALSYQPALSGATQPLDLPFVAETDGNAGVAIEDVTGPVVTVRGAGSGADFLRIGAPDGTLYDRKALVAAPIAQIALLPSNGERLGSGATLALSTSATTLAVAYTAAGGTRLADESATLALAGATQTAWDTLTLATPAAGTAPLTVTAGGRTTTLDVPFVDHVEAIVIVPGPPVVVHAGGEVCFAATAAGNAVVGLTWHFAAPAGLQVLGGDAPNCMGMQPAATGTVPIAVTAGDLTATVDVPVVAAVAPVPPASAPAGRSPAGERAELVRLAAP